MSFVASQAKAHALKPPAPQAPRPLPASDRTPPPPFESLLDSGTQATVPPAPIAPPAKSEAASKRGDEPKATGAAPPAKPDQPDKKADSGKTASGDETADNAGDVRDAGPETKTKGKAIAGKAAGNGEIGDDKIDDGGDGKTETGAKKAVAKTDAAPAQPAADKPAGVAAPVAAVVAAPTAAVHAADTAAAPAKDEAVIGAPKPAASADAAAPADDDGVQAAPAARPAVAAETPKDKAAALLAAQAEAGKPADGKKNDADAKAAAKYTPAHAAKDAPAQQTEAKPQPAATPREPDKQADAHARGEIQADAHRGVNAHRAAPTEAHQPPVDPAAAAKPGAEVSQPVVLSTPSHAGGATSANAVPPAPPTAPSVPQQAVPLAGLAIAIAARALPGGNRFEIRLDPPELGRIEVRLDVDRDGRVTSHLIADRQDTLNLLQRDASGLQRALQDAGLKTSDNGLQFSLRDQSGGTPQNASAAPAAQIVVEDEALAPLDAAHSGHARLARLRGGLDIRV